MNIRTHKITTRGIAPVISTLILSVVVITVGGAVWAYSQGASVSISQDYVEGVFTLMNEATERFMIEQVFYNSAGNILSIWVYNFGNIDILVDVYANTSDQLFGSNLDNALNPKEVMKIDLSLVIPEGTEVSIKVVSRRGNNAFYTYFVI